mgnify:CR=1 FL=1
MPRTLALTLLALASVPTSALAQPGGAALATFDPSLAAAAAEAPAADAEPGGDAQDDYADDETYDEETEYCGGEGSVLDEAGYALESGDPVEAYTLLVGALRAGAVEEWERGYAFALLAELQLRRGEPGRALGNFARAERVEPGSTSSRRAHLATALYLRGRRAAAREAAREAREDVCSDRYAANVVLSRAERDAAARAAAAEALATLRATYPDSAAAFALVDAWVAGS